MKKLLSCPVCETIFRWRSSGPHTFCSRKCANLAQHKEPEERICEVCDKMFLVGPHGYGYASYEAKRCSPKCRRLGRQRVSAKANELLPTDAAYLAGLVDGEGSFTVYLRKNGTAITRLSITNCDLPLLEWCKNITGIGSVQTRIHQHPEKWKTSYAWVVSTGSAGSVIVQIKSFLKVKKQQAELILTILERLSNPALKADRTWQLEYSNQMRSMNKRGPNQMDLTLTAGMYVTS